MKFFVSTGRFYSVKNKLTLLFIMDFFLRHNVDQIHFLTDLDSFNSY